MRDEQETGADSEAASTAVLEDPLAENLAGVKLIQRITSFHSTPLPDAETLSVYAKLIPNGADRVMTLVEHETEHRHRLESADTRHMARGHWMSFIVILALASGGICLGLSGHDWLAGALFTTTICAVATSLVVDGKSRKKPVGPREPGS
jgi:uncharacterized membrane protein